MEYIMNTLVKYAPLLAQGIMITTMAWLISAIISIVIGSLLGIVSCHYLAASWIKPFIRGYTFIAKGIPAYVQILIAYFVIPSLLGISISGFSAATMALIFCSSGYTTEIIRAGINALPRGQWDACFVLGYPLSSTLKRIIVPQVIKTSSPALCGELEQLLKSTSLLATIGVTEVTRVGMNIISRELNPLPIYCMIAVVYLCFSAIIQWFILSLEQRM
jgi:His/Glu/Gln/Arg/opine family amino acid ABC transporter permease subunit